ncbi:MAG: hypothetical protein ACREX8_18350 [Gammaproteobacteria bacterium]
MAVTLPDFTAPATATTPNGRTGLPLYAAEMVQVTTAITTVDTALAGKAAIAHTHGGPHCLVKRTSNLAISAATTTLVTWQSDELDTDTMWTSGDPTVVTVKTAGLWWVAMNVSFSSPDNGNIRWAFLTLNSTDTSTSILFAGTTGNGRACAASTIKTLAANDVLRVYVYSADATQLQYNFGETKLAAKLWA